jgi:hypothetical protein
MKSTPSRTNEKFSGRSTCESIGQMPQNSASSANRCSIHHAQPWEGLEQSTHSLSPGTMKTGTAEPLRISATS